LKLGGGQKKETRFLGENGFLKTPVAMDAMVRQRIVYPLRV
jgi:hypothetical protein